MLFTILLPALLLSCRKEDGINLVEKSRNETNLVFQVSQEMRTRAAGSVFDAGDRIGIYVVRHQPDDAPVLKPSGNYADNKCYDVVDGTLEPVTEDDAIYGEAGYVYTIYAYYPYNDTLSNPTSIYGEVELDQTRETDFKRSDFMVAWTTCADAGSPISLFFTRKLSCIEVVYDKIDGIAPKSVALYGAWSEYRVNLQTGVLQRSGNHCYVTPFQKYAETDGQCLYRMIVPPHNLASGGRFQVDLYDRLEYYDVEGVFLGEGVKNTFYLDRREHRVTCTAVSPGGTGGTVGCEEMTVVHGRSCTVSAFPDAGCVFDGWFKDGVRVSSELEYAFAVTEDVRLEARFHKERVRVTIACHPSKDVLAPYYPGYNSETEYDYGEEVTLYGYIVSNSPYVFDGWYEDGRYLNRDYEYRFTAMRDRNLVAKYGLKVLGANVSKGMGVLDQPGYFTRSLVHDGKPEHLEKGQRVRVIGGASYQTFIEEYSTPITITDKKLCIKWGDQIAWEGEDFEDFIFTVPQSGDYSLHSSMSVRGYLKEGERVSLTLLLDHSCWILPNN